MSGSNPRDIADNFARPIQAALHCVTQAKLTTPVPNLGERQILTFQHGEPVELRRHGDQARLFLQITLHYRVILVADEPRERESLRVVADGYMYSIFDNRLREVLGFHWQPNPSSGTRAYPHLHIGSRVIDTSDPTFGKSFSSLHIPTGLIAVEDVVRFLIEEMQVIPLHDGWLQVVTENLEAHGQFRSSS